MGFWQIWLVTFATILGILLLFAGILFYLLKLLESNVLFGVAIVVLLVVTLLATIFWIEQL